MEQQPEHDNQLQLFPYERNEEVSKQQRRWGRIAVAATAVVAVTGVLGWAAYDHFAGDSGELTHWDPSVETKSMVDGKNVVLSWNVKNEASDLLDEIEQSIDAFNPDVFAMQEISKDDAAALHDRFPGWYVYFVMADGKYRDGGFGNAMMSRQSIEDIERFVIDGNSVPDEGKRTVTGALNTSTKEIIDATQEDRVVFGGNIDIATSDGEAQLRILNLHISGDKQIHLRQFNELKDIIIKQKKKGIETLVVGDFNSSFDQVAQNFTQEGFIVPQTGPTTKGAEPKPIDFYMQQADVDGPLGMPTVKVVPMVGSDHNMIYAESWAK